MSVVLFPYNRIYACRLPPLFWNQKLYVVRGFRTKTLIF